MRAIGVGHRFGRRGRPVLRDVELDLRPGQAIQIRGANGSGKTTLLRLLAGIAAPTDGRILDRPADAAYVPDRLPGVPPFSAREYLDRCGRMRGAGSVGARVQADAELEAWGLVRDAETPIRQLSKGNRQKVMVAQAMMAVPGRSGLLVLDEPWTALDGAAQRLLCRRLLVAREAGSLVIYADHQTAAPTSYRPSPDLAYDVTAGRVATGPVTDPPGGRSPGSSAPSMLVDLTGSLPPELLAEAGVEPVDDPVAEGGAHVLAGQRIRVRVPAHRCDEFLRAALAAGASVLRVVPEPAEHGR